MSTSTLLTVDIDLIVGGDNIRTDLGDLKELAASIKSNGILEPLLVREQHADDGSGQGRYEVVAGHRRLAAAKKAGVVAVPVVVRAFTDDERDEAMLIENLQRKDLTPVEEARGYFRLVERGMDAKTLASRIGRSTEHVKDRLALLELDDEALAAVHTGALSLSNAEALLVMKEAGVRDSLVQPVRDRALEGGYNVTNSAKEAVAAEKKHRLGDKIVAKAEKAGLPVFVRRSRADKFTGQRVGVNVNPGYDEKIVRVDAEAHKGEPCHVIYVDLTGYGAKPSTESGCSDPSRHLAKGDSALKPPKRSKPEVPEGVRKAQEKAAARVARRNERLAEVARKVSAGDLNKMLLAITLADIDSDDAKNAVRLLGLDVIKVDHGWEKKADGTPKQTADYHLTLEQEANGSPAGARRVAAALVIVRLHEGYRLRGSWKAHLADLIDTAAVALCGPDPDAPKKTEPKPADEPEPLTAEPLPVDPEPVTGQADESDGALDPAPCAGCGGTFAVSALDDLMTCADCRPNDDYMHEGYVPGDALADEASGVVDQELEALADEDALAGQQ